MSELRIAIRNGTLWSDQLRDIINTTDKLQPLFLGIFSHDQIPSVAGKPNQFAIWNLANANQAGSHWVTGIIGTPSLYFDPFGVPPDARSLQFLTQNGQKVLFNSIDLQEFHSSECGWYCLAFLISILVNGMTFDRTLSQFHQHKGWFNERQAVRIVDDGEKVPKNFLDEEKMPSAKSVKQGMNRKLTMDGHPELRVHRKKAPNAYATFVKQKMSGRHFGSRQEANQAMKQVAAQWHAMH
jgi:hypothetical protein